MSMWDRMPGARLTDAALSVPILLLLVGFTLVDCQAGRFDGWGDARLRAHRLGINEWEAECITPMQR